jgi:hypothetical protein
VALHGFDDDLLRLRTDFQREDAGVEHSYFGNIAVCRSAPRLCQQAL